MHTKKILKRPGSQSTKYLLVVRKLHGSKNNR